MMRHLQPPIRSANVACNGLFRLTTCPAHPLTAIPRRYQTTDQTKGQPTDDHQKGPEAGRSRQSLIESTLPRVLGGGLIAVVGVIGGVFINGMAERATETNVRDRLSRIATETDRWKHIETTMGALTHAEKLRQDQEFERERQERGREVESDRNKIQLAADLKEAETVRVQQERERELQERAREEKDLKGQVQLKAFTDKLLEQETERERQERQREQQENMRVKIQESANLRWTDEMNQAERTRRDQEMERERQERDRETRQTIANQDRERFQAFMTRTKEDLAFLGEKLKSDEQVRSIAEAIRHSHEQDRELRELLRCEKELSRDRGRVSENSSELHSKIRVLEHRQSMKGECK